MKIKRHLLVALMAVTGLFGVGQAPGQDEPGAWRPASGALTVNDGAERIVVRTLPAEGSVQRTEFRFPALRMGLGADGQVAVQMPTAEYGSRVGEPVLPILSTRFAIPRGHELVAVRVTPGAVRRHSVEKPVRHAQAPHPLSRPQDYVETPPDAAIYGQDDPYPKQIHTPYSVQTKRGVDLVHFVLHPVRYRPASGLLETYETLTVDVETKPIDVIVLRSADDGPLPWRARFRSETDALAVTALVDNPDLVAGFETDPKPEAVTSRGSVGIMSDDLLPCSPSTNFTYVIITSEDLRDSLFDDNFSKIVALREAQGMPATIVTVERINQIYRENDLQSSIRAFIRDAYNKWNTEFVLLGGGVGVIPTRNLIARVGFTRALIPGDLYYQCLDGSFDSNANNVFGEPVDGADRMDGRPGEDIDLYAEVAIGRIPVGGNDIIALGHWVRKQVLYESDRLAKTQPYLRGAMMIGEHLGFGGVSEYGDAMMEEIRLGSAAHGYVTAGFVHRDIHTNIVTLYDAPADEWTVEDLAALINENRYSVLNHLGHSFYNYNMKFDLDDVDLLENAKPVFLYTQGCWAGAFEYGDNNIAVRFLSHSNHGMFGGVFNSRFGWGARNSTDGPSQRYNRQFWHAFFSDMIPVTGLLQQQAKERNAARIDDPAMRWIYYTSNLLGDPAQWLYGYDPSVALDREAYQSTAQAIVEVLWPMVGEGLREVNVAVVMTNAAGVEVGSSNLVCRRSGAVSKTGLFVSEPLSLADLGAEHGGRVYVSAELSINAAAETVTDDAPIDDVPPVISNLRVIAVDEQWLDIAFDTDKPTRGAARAGTSLDLLGDWFQAPAGYRTNHQVRMTGLDDFTKYFVEAFAEDLAGNVATTNLVDGAPFTITTIGRETVRLYDFERSSEGWSVTNIDGVACWEYGRPLAYGPPAATRLWGTILEGRYPNGANAYLTSEPIAVRGAPLIQFRHWHDLQYSLDQENVMASPVPYGDKAQIEVRLNNVWHNVTRYADVAAGRSFISGRSEGWQRVRIILPPEFAHQSLAVRFRLLSDQQEFGSGNPAGWYIDDVLVRDVPDSGLGISQLDIVDDPASAETVPAGVVGDADGRAEAGETVAIRPRLYNFSTNAVGPLAGGFVVLVEGNPSEHAQLLPDTPAAVGYPQIVPQQGQPASPWTLLALSPDLANGSLVTVIQTLTNASGRIFESRHDFRAGRYVNIAGTVVEDTAQRDPIAGARLLAVREQEQHAAQADENGQFAIFGAEEAGVYSVTAAADGYTPRTVTVQAPTNGLEIALGQSRVFLTPTNLVLTAWPGGSATESFTVSNATHATAPLRASIREIRYLTAQTDWVAVTPSSVELAAGDARVLSVSCDASEFLPGEYRAILIMETDDATQPEIWIQIFFLVLQDPDLAYGGALIDGDDNDNGWLEAGETGSMWIYLNNSAGLSYVTQVEGDLAFRPRAHQAADWVVPTGSTQMDWTYIGAYSSQLSDNGVEMSLDAAILDREELDFRLTARYHTGAAYVTNVFDFTYTHRMTHTVTGLVERLIWEEGTDDFEREPLEGAVVRAESPDGLIFSSEPTGPDGVYQMFVLSGDQWFTALAPLDYPHIAPAGSNVTVVADETPVNFLFGDYGIDAANIKLFDVQVVDADGDGSIDPGERLLLTVRLYNLGLNSAQSVTGRVERADMGLVPPSMDVISANSTAPVTVLRAPYLWTPSEGPYLYELGVFEVEVHADAVPGDEQRFLLYVGEPTAAGRLWPLDFKLTVNPMYDLSGTVTYESDGSPVAGAAMRLRFGNTVRTVIADAAGFYAFRGIPHTARDVRVSVDLQQGESSDPPQRLIPAMDADYSGMDFVIEQGLLTVEPASLHAILYEGTSASESIRIHNGRNTNITVRMAVEYHRGDSDLVAPEDDPVLGPIMAAPFSDWAQLNAEDYAENEIVIRFADNTGWMERHEILRQHGLRALFHLKLVPACVAVPVDVATLGGGAPAQLAPLAQSLAADARVLYVQPSARAYPLNIPNDPMFDQQYALRNQRQTGGTQGADINVLPVWENHTVGSRDVVVAVLDTGMEYTHPDLRSNLWLNTREQNGDANLDGYPGVRFIDDDGDAERSRWHLNSETGQMQGPQLIHELFSPEMWVDNETWQLKVGSLEEYEFAVGPNDIPDYFERYVSGHETLQEMIDRATADPPLNVWGEPIANVFRDSNGDGIPDLFTDSNGDGVPDIFNDGDGDGLYNETGVDFRDEDVMTADYNNNGRPLLIQKFVQIPWPYPEGDGNSINVMVEQWDVVEDPWSYSVWYELDENTGVLVGNGRTGLSGMEMAAWDDDENGYVNDFYGWNFADNVGEIGPPRTQNNGHGTHVAGIVGAVGDNGEGVSGVNQQVRLMTLRLVNEGMEFTTFPRIAQAMEYAVMNGARVSNHSYGGTVTAGVFYEVMKRAERDFNHLFVMAAGNDADDNDSARTYPANYSAVLDNAITVAATDHDNQLAWFSNFGMDTVQVGAPGVNILSTVPDEGYSIMSGTSMAAPQVAGAAALLWAHAPQAGFRAIRNALVAGARPEPNLAGWVQSGGNLDVGRALQALGREWLALETNLVEIAAHGYADVAVTFNPEQNTPGGMYEAEIVLTSDIAGTRRVAATMTVLEQPVARFSQYRITADTDGDGLAEPTETVAFHVTLRNAGSGSFANLQGALAALTPGATVLDDASDWDFLFSGEEGESLSAFRVSLPASLPAEEAVFEMTLTADGLPSPQTVQFSLATAVRHTIYGRVLDVAGDPVAQAPVEARGAAGGYAVSGADGSYALHGLQNGAYVVRALPAQHTRSADLAVVVADQNSVDQDLVVGAPDATFSLDGIETSLRRGQSLTNVLTVANTALLPGDAYDFHAEFMPRRRIGLFADGASLAVLKAPLERMGFAVDLFTNNFDIVQITYPSGFRQVLQEVRYTQDDSTVFDYDLVIVDPTGRRGDGRVFTDAEADVFTRYVERGGMAIFTGGNPLNRPDNQNLAALCGVDVAGRTAEAVAEARATGPWNGVFVALADGDRMAVAPRRYDLAPPLAETETLAMAGDAAKITRRSVSGSPRNGAVYLWGGNHDAEEWSRDGVWLDMLRDLLREHFVKSVSEQEHVSWLQVTPVAGTASNSSVDLSVALETQGLEPGLYRAVIALRGLDRGEEVYALPVDLTVHAHVVRAYTTGTVSDWRNQPLLGNGNEGSALYQLIYAGSDGVPNRPATNATGFATGAPSGDDRLLATFPAGRAYGRFGDGEGVPADSGKFNGLFGHSLSNSPVVYVRAWDAASFASSLAYGDSSPRPLALTESEAVDFGSWLVNVPIDYQRDSNTNSLPDGWLMEHRPDLDPRAPPTPLPTAFSTLGVTSILKQPPANPLPEPYRVVTSEDGVFTFVLDKTQNRIVVFPSATPAQQTFFGGSGSGEGQFSQPEGLAVDPRPGVFRLAVADTGNHRVQLFTYDPATGALTFERAFGGAGSGNGQLNRPGGLALDRNGVVYVADTDNNRIAKFNAANGSWGGSFQGPSTTQVNAPQGVCVDEDPVAGGIWVADSGNDRVTLYNTGGTIARRTFGTQGTANGQFNTPVDVQVWRHRWIDRDSGTVLRTKRRLAVVDKLNGRVQVFAMDGTHLMNAGRNGGAGSTVHGDLSQPHGVFPLMDRSEMIVADTGNARIQRFSVVMDLDGDGMDDLWEDVNGLDSTRNDAFEDADHDGLYNIAEYLLGLDPQNEDTNGDGWTDGDAVAAGLDPTEDNTLLLPHYTLTAQPDPWRAGEDVTLTLTFNHTPPDPPVSPLILELGGDLDEQVELELLAGTTNVYRGAYTPSPLFTGSVSPALAGLPPISGGLGPVAIVFPPFSIQAVGDGGTGLQLTWPTVNGARYAVETNAALGATGWGVYVEITADGAQSEVAMDTGSPVLFFRIRRVSGD